jgi:hypothetical protein
VLLAAPANTTRPGDASYDPWEIRTARRTYQ